MQTNPQNIFRLDGKTALVTGGGSGIGLAIAKCLAFSGAKVIIAGRNVETLKAALPDIEGDAIAAALDLSDIASLSQKHAEITAQHGDIDILVNNAGNTIKKPFEDGDMADFDAVFDVHVRGALELSRQVIKQQIQGRGGNILFTSSMTAFIGQPNVLGYTVSKTAISGVIRGLAAEFSGRGIRINGVAPGWIDTELYRQATKGDIPRQEKIRNRIPAGHLGEPADIGWACTFLASEAAKYITGQVLLVDGGGATGF